ncbi:MAG: OmpA family protein [Deltaproteobacteria bacterium]|nr:OmpA family protein [Deltaproteobacteria bacterium]
MVDFGKYYVQNLTYTIVKSKHITHLRAYKIKKADFHIAKLLNVVGGQVRINQAYKKLKTAVRTFTVSGFAFNHYNLTSQMKSLLNRIKPFLQNKRVTIIGYTDHFGTKAYNNRLALKRAKTARNYLHIKARVKGYGKCCYISKTNRINRRVIIQVSK